MTPIFHSVSRSRMSALLGCSLLATIAMPAIAHPAHRHHCKPHPIASAADPARQANVRAAPGHLPIASANAAARVQPDKANYQNAIQQYPYADGSLYQVYSAPGEITDIVLQEGEQLVGAGPVAAGDTVRWIIGNTVSGTGANARVHILVKPTRGDIATNLVINTDRRTYHLELHGFPEAYMASVSWTYPQDQLIALKAAADERERTAPVATAIDMAALDFRYRIGGDRPTWKPIRVFDDGRQVFIEFAEGIATGDMPPLFAIGENGAVELLNYRVKGRYMVVDRLFGVAELRLGAGKHIERVRIERQADRGRRAA